MQDKEKTELSILNPNNPYGYKFNVNHPAVRRYYDVFKNKRNILIPSDAERREFEDALTEIIEKAKKEN